VSSASSRCPHTRMLNEETDCGEFAAGVITLWGDPPHRRLGCRCIDFEERQRFREAAQLGCGGFLSMMLRAAFPLLPSASPLCRTCLVVAHTMTATKAGWMSVTKSGF
jgi:hypothetical protein